jgi:formylglycine-generating enzyme required for sulfatase activity
MTDRQHKSTLWKALGLYAAVSWVVLQVVDLLADNIGLPSWVFTSALILLIIGLPVVGATAYLHGQGPARESKGGLARRLGETRSLFTWRNAMLVGMATFAVWGLVAAGWLVLRELGPNSGQSGPEVVSPTGTLSVSTAPPGAAVRLSRIVDAAEAALGDPVELGLSPVEAETVATGDYLLEIIREGSNRLVLLGSVAEGEELRIAAELVPDASLTAHMVLVPTGPAPVGVGGMPVRGFLVDQHEVTNEEYARFVVDRGYETANLWPDSMFAGGEFTPRAEAVARLTDRSSATGPRDWSGSLYSAGTGSHPVTGVSWYEANAYCLWAGKRLPSGEQWWRAALGNGERAYPWGTVAGGVESRAAFNVEQARPAESLPLGVSPFGAYDMAGNAREWVQPESTDAKMAPSIGGSWQAPEYTFGVDWQEELPLGFADETTGFRCVRHTD